MHGIQKIKFTCLFRYYDLDFKLVRAVPCTENESYDAAESIRDSKISMIVKVDKDGKRVGEPRFYTKDSKLCPKYGRNIELIFSKLIKTPNNHKEG